MSVWPAIVLAGVASYLLRALPVAWLTSRAAPVWMDRVGPLVPPVAFAALAGSSYSGTVTDGMRTAVPVLVAAVVTAVVARVTGASGRAVLAGLVTVWGLSALL
jgi:branched-subunit amino acid transport protein